MIAAGILYGLFRSTWMFWRQSIYKIFKWVLLEIRIPREIQNSPYGMEQVLAAIHSLRNTPNNLWEWYWAGEVTRWYSLELVSFGGETHFYVRCYFRQKGLVEAAFFSQYPDLELVEVEDYVDKIPDTVKELDQLGYDMWGSEMLLDKPSAYPIKTYHEFESPDENKEIDPISAFLEVLGKVKKEEMVAIQILIAPADYRWRDEFHNLVEKLKEPKIKKEEIKGGEEGQFASFAKMIARSPGEIDILKAVENNLSKPAFDTLIRFVYLSPKQIFYDSFARRAITGSFNQYAALNLNRFRQNYTISTRTMFWFFPYFFPVRRNLYRKQRLFYEYKLRHIPPQSVMGRFMSAYFLNWNFASRRFKINTECLATVYHPPTAMVLTAPHIPRVPSRKAGPPAGLAIFGDEKLIEKFQ